MEGTLDAVSTNSPPDSNIRAQMWTKGVEDIHDSFVVAKNCDTSSQEVKALNLFAFDTRTLGDSVPSIRERRRITDPRRLHIGIAALFKGSPRTLCLVHFQDFASRLKRRARQRIIAESVKFGGGDDPGSESVELLFFYSGGWRLFNAMFNSSFNTMRFVTT